MKVIASSIASACQTLFISLSDNIIPHWLHIANCLIALRRTNVPTCHWYEKENSGITADPAFSSHLDHDSRLKRWRHFGKLLGLDEVQLRHTEMEQRVSVMGGLHGCAWYRCPSYRTSCSVSGRELLACSGCKKVCLATEWKCPANPIRTGSVLLVQMPAEVRTGCV